MKGSPVRVRASASRKTPLAGGFPGPGGATSLRGGVRSVPIRLASVAALHSSSPLACGGTDERSNLRAAHRSCNRRRARRGGQGVNRAVASRDATPPAFGEMSRGSSRGSGFRRGRGVCRVKDASVSGSANRATRGSTELHMTPERASALGRRRETAMTLVEQCLNRSRVDQRALAPVVISLLAAVLAGCGGGDSDQALAERTVLERTTYRARARD